MGQRGVPEVLCVGAVTADVIALVDELPAGDERVEDTDIVLAGGGPAATAALALARLGVSVAFVGVVGDDALADVALAGLRDSGVDLSRVERDRDRPTARSLVLIERNNPGRRIITSQRFHVPRLIDAPPSPWVHVDQLGYRAIQNRCDLLCNSKLSVDGGNPIAELDLKHVNLFAPTLSRLLADYPGPVMNAIASARSRGADVVVATDGPNGAWIGAKEFADGRPQQVPGYSLAVVSTLGAGDVFHGALLAGLVRGIGLQETVRVANGAAALSCLALDGQSGVPDWPTLERFLADNAR